MSKMVPRSRLESFQRMDGKKVLRRPHTYCSPKAEEIGSTGICPTAGTMEPAPGDEVGQEHRAKEPLVRIPNGGTYSTKTSMEILGLHRHSILP